MEKDRIFLGVTYACIAFAMFTLSHAINKLLVDQHHAIEIAFWRNFICLVPCLIYVLITKKTDLLKTTMPLTLGFRVFIGTVGLVLTLAAVQHLPVSNATVLFFTSTLIIPPLAHFWLKEHIGLHRWAAVIIGMGGVIIIAQPNADVTLIGIVLALAAACVHASIQVLIRVMKNQPPFTITFYFFAGGSVILLPFMPFFWNTPTWYSAAILLLIGITGGAGQYFLTRGFQMAPTSLLGPFNYTGLIWATLLDIAIWSYIPGWNVFTGAAIIISAQAYIIYREKQHAKNKAL